jgi:5-methylcytosine-specific restriction protein A
MPERLPTFRPPWVNRKPKRDAVRRDQTAAGYSRRAWKLARQERLVLDNYQCQDCGRVVTGRDANVDHVVPKAAGGSDYMDNLRTLCRSCHSRKTVLVDQGGGFGPMVGRRDASELLSEKTTSRPWQPRDAAGALPKK